ncbi:hypothetical protein KI387_016353, partial [Taxus chinensis]
ISGNSVYMVSSDDEDYSKTSECEKVRDRNGRHKPKRTLPPRKSKNPKMDYSELSLLKIGLTKQGLTQENANELLSYKSIPTGK